MGENLSYQALSHPLVTKPLWMSYNAHSTRDEIRAAIGVSSEVEEQKTRQNVFSSTLQYFTKTLGAEKKW